MPKQFQAVRGMNDILPAHTPLWSRVEAIVRALLDSYGYREMRIPVIENTALFKRSIGEVTDIVEKEMFAVTNREDDDSLTLRPEATAGFVRACIQHGLLHNQSQRIWCIGPMFRHEKPQRGRYRQFHQIDVEAFALPGPDIDAELICMSARLWRLLGLQDIHLQINSLGSNSARKRYREQLIAYFEQQRDSLDEESVRRLQRNPMRILDSKNKKMTAIIDAAPQLIDYLDDDSAQHFEQLQTLLNSAGISFEINPKLVRGLDYYNKTVFEWVTGSLGAQNAICGGGRYDGLVEHLGGRSTPGIGFAIGMDRIIDMLSQSDTLSTEAAPHAYLVADGEAAQAQALALAERLREQIPGFNLLMHCAGGSFKSQFKRADQSGAVIALILGEEEINSASISVKLLREHAEQLRLNEQALIVYLRDKLMLAA